MGDDAGGNASDEGPRQFVPIDLETNFETVEASKAYYAVARIRELRDEYAKGSASPPSLNQQAPQIGLLRRPRARYVKAIIFSQFKESIWRTRVAFAQQRIKAASFIGGIKSTERMKQLLKFRNDPSVSVLLLTEMGSHGLDLSFVTHVFLMDEIWDKSLEKQVISRAHRMGATQSVVIEQLVMRDSIETVMRTMNERGLEDIIKEEEKEDRRIEHILAAKASTSSANTASTSSGSKKRKRNDERTETPKDSKTSALQHRLHYVLNNLRLVHQNVCAEPGQVRFCVMNSDKQLIRRGIHMMRSPRERAVTSSVEFTPGSTSSGQSPTLINLTSEQSTNAGPLSPARSSSLSSPPVSRTMHPPAASNRSLARVGPPSLATKSSQQTRAKPHSSSSVQQPFAIARPAPQTGVKAPRTFAEVRPPATRTGPPPAKIAPPQVRTEQPVKSEPRLSKSQPSVPRSSSSSLPTRSGLFSSSQPARAGPPPVKVAAKHTSRTATPRKASPSSKSTGTHSPPRKAPEVIIIDSSSDGEHKVIAVPSIHRPTASDCRISDDDSSYIEDGSNRGSGSSSSASEAHNISEGALDNESASNTSSSSSSSSEDDSDITHMLQNYHQRSKSKQKRTHLKGNSNSSSSSEDDVDVTKMLHDFHERRKKRSKQNDLNGSENNHGSNSNSSGDDEDVARMLHKFYNTMKKKLKQDGSGNSSSSSEDGSEMKQLMFNFLNSTRKRARRRSTVGSVKHKRESETNPSPAKRQKVEPARASTPTETPTPHAHNSPSAKSPRGAKSPRSTQCSKSEVKKIGGRKVTVFTVEDSDDIDESVEEYGEATGESEGPNEEDEAMVTTNATARPSDIKKERCVSTAKQVRFDSVGSEVENGAPSTPFAVIAESEDNTSLEIQRLGNVNEETHSPTALAALIEVKQDQLNLVDVEAELVADADIEDNSDEYEDECVDVADGNNINDSDNVEAGQSPASIKQERPSSAHIEKSSAEGAISQHFANIVECSMTTSVKQVSVREELSSTQIQSGAVGVPAAQPAPPAYDDETETESE